MNKEEMTEEALEALHHNFKKDFKKAVATRLTDYTKSFVRLYNREMKKTLDRATGKLLPKDDKYKSFIAERNEMFKRLERDIFDYLTGSEYYKEMAQLKIDMLEARENVSALKEAQAKMQSIFDDIEANVNEKNAEYRIVSQRVNQLLTFESEVKVDRSLENIDKKATELKIPLRYIGSDLWATTPLFNEMAEKDQIIVKHKQALAKANQRRLF